MQRALDIRARVEGFLDSIDFSEGSFVREGDLLYQIDLKPLEAALAQAKANLANNKARLDQATVTVNRMKPLAEQQAVSLQELDSAGYYPDPERDLKHRSLSKN